MRNHLSTCLWPALLMLVALACPKTARAVDEDELKAAIILNIMTFVDWPADASPSVGDPWVLCAGSRSALAPALKALEGRPVHNSRLLVRDIQPGAITPPCHALYIEARDGLHAATAAQPGTLGSLLVISDDAALPSPAASVILRAVGNRLGFDINLHAAREARLQLSSKLVRLAKVVKQ